MLMMLPRVRRKCGSASRHAAKTLTRFSSNSSRNSASGEVVDGLVRRVPARVVDEAVDAPRAADGLRDEVFEVGILRHVARHEVRRALQPARVQLGGERRARPLVARRDDDHRARLREDARAPLADAPAPAGHDHDLFCVPHPAKDNSSMRLYAKRSARPKASGEGLKAEGRRAKRLETGRLKPLHVFVLYCSCSPLACRWAVV